jgi:hypothetical protein
VEAPGSERIQLAAFGAAHFSNLLVRRKAGERIQASC